jgi:hypothetical protein
VRRGRVPGRIRDQALEISGSHLALKASRLPVVVELANHLPIRKLPGRVLCHRSVGIEGNAGGSVDDRFVVGGQRPERYCRDATIGWRGDWAARTLAKSAAKLNDGRAVGATRGDE